MTKVDQSYDRKKNLGISFEAAKMARFLSFFTLLAAACLLPDLTAGKVDPSISTQLLWPMPNSVEVGDQALSIDSTTFKFVPQGANAGSDTLKAAISRYSDFIFKSPVPFYPSAANVSAAGELNNLTISVSSTDEKLGLGTDESCKLGSSASSAELPAAVIIKFELIIYLF